MTGPLIQVQTGPILELRLNRPERRNALSPELVGLLRDAAVRAEADPDVGAVVLGAEGDRFCAGGDLGPGGLVGDGFLEQHRSRGVFAALMQAIMGSSIPWIAAVQGDALGGGCGLAMACHMSVMDPKATLGTPELKVGLFPMMIAPVLSRKIPRAVLYEMILCRRRLTSAEALTLGVINRVSEPGQALEESRALAQKAAANSRAVAGLGLKAMHLTEGLPLERSLEVLNSQLSLNLLTEDAGEGITAFLMRRDPVWKGR
jgi:enoyl-CoA hydratase